jgi:mannosyltransferase OCH1-like enzyme
MTPNSKDSKDFKEERLKKGIFVYNLPLLRNWHSYTNLKEVSGKTYQYFGYNWWDLMASRILQKSKYAGFGHLVVEVPKYNAGLAFVNCTEDPIRVKNNFNGEIYLVDKYSSRLYNVAKKNNLEAEYKECLMQYVLIGEAVIILLGLEKILNGTSQITKTPLFTNFLLCSGVINTHQYYSTTGLNAYLSKIIRDNKTNKMYSDDDSSMMSWVNLLEYRWNYVNPNKKIKRNKNIVTVPHKIHWIWLSKKKNIHNPVKTKYYKFMRSWILRNPKFEYYLWTDSDEIKLPQEFDCIKIMYTDQINELLDKIPNESKHGIKYMFKNHPNVGSRADTLRQCILYVIGGIYADINDMLCQIPLQSYLDKFDFMAAVEPMLYINNAFIASRPKHIVSKNFLKYISQNSKYFVDSWDPNASKEDKDNLVVSQTGPIAFSSIIFGIIDNSSGSIVCPHSCIFPSKFIYSNYEIKESPLSWLSPVTLSSHWDSREFLKDK